MGSLRILNGPGRQAQRGSAILKKPFFDTPRGIWADFKKLKWRCWRGVVLLAWGLVAGLLGVVWDASGSVLGRFGAVLDE